MTRTAFGEIKESNTKRRHKGKGRKRNTTQSNSRRLKKLEDEAATVEKKSLTVEQYALRNLTSAGSVVDYVHPIIQGLNVVDRIGNEIHIDSIFFRYYLQVGLNNTDHRDTMVRMIFLRYKNEEGQGAPQFGDILANPNSANDAIIFSPYANNIINRFQILKDEVFHLRVATGFHPETISGEFYWKNKNLKELTQYNQPGSAAANRQSNQYYVMWVSNMDGTAGPPNQDAPDFRVFYKTTYTDL